MVVVGTIFDKSLKEKVFYIREVDGYSHSTTTSLNVDYVDGVFTLTAVVGNILGKGFVKFYKDGVEIGEQYVSKTATLLYPSETTDGVFMARFMGNSDCLKSESANISYNRVDTSMEISSNSSTYKYVGDTVTVTVLLKDEEGTAISDATVSDGTANKVTGADGKATFTYSNTSVGTVTKNYSYSGDVDYNSCTGSISWSVSLLGTTFTLTSDKSSYVVGSTVTLTGTLKDVRGNAVPNVTVSVDGASLTTDSKGVVTKSYGNLAVGSYSKFASFSGTSKYMSSNVTVSFKVVDKNVPVLSVSANKSSYYVGDTTTVTCTLKDSDGSVMSGVSISDGSTSATTNSSGVATFTYSNTASGSVSKR